MDTENTASAGGTSTSASTDTSTTSSNETSQASSAPSGESAPQGHGKTLTGLGNGVGATQAGVTTPAQPAWSPSFEFTVKDKKHQFDEWLRPAITTKEQEAKMRELYEKAFGLDDIKDSRETLRTERDDYKTKFTNIEQSLKAVSGYVQKKDYRTFFDILKIPKSDIINYAVQELKYEQLPAEQRAAEDAKRQQQAEFEYYQQNNQTLQQQMQEMKVEQNRQTLHSELARPEVAATVQAFDTRAGKPGAFARQVIERGAYYEAVHKVSVPAGQLVQEVLNIVGGMVPPSQPGQAPSLTPPGQAAGQLPPQQKPVIPGFSGSSSKSPTKKTISSIDDIKKRRAELLNQQT